MLDCRITAIRRSRYQDLIDKYENPIDDACSIEVGQEFLSVNAQKPAGFCDSAWETLRPFVERLAVGETGLFDHWLKNERSVILSCNDGLRPVSFLVEAVKK